ncbi:hypothetical protein C8Q74DRAFT_1449832 [Fomes fomentarius]|nr:hypothetical protein C8Q74DRAFT_1449832 [Fomes fomentarius]
MPSRVQSDDTDWLTHTSFFCLCLSASTQTSHSPSLSLLVAAHTLECPIVSNKAKERLSGLWSGTAEHVPDAASERESRLPHTDALHIAHGEDRARAARHARPPQARILRAPLDRRVLQAPALHRPTGWPSLPIAEADVLMLVEARLALEDEDEGRVARLRLGPAVLQEAATVGRGVQRRAACPKAPRDGQQVNPVRVEVDHPLEPGGSVWRQEDSEFCAKCFKQKEDAWRERRIVWWAELDKLFKW